MWQRSVAPFQGRDDVAMILLVIAPSDRSEFISSFGRELDGIQVISGGSSRAESIWNALAAVPDEIDSEQQTLDAQQGEENAVQYITVEQARSLMAEQTRAVVSQVAGLQGKIDNGLNAVRRDSQQWIEQNIGPIMQEQKIQAILKDVPEDQHE